MTRQTFNTILLSAIGCLLLPTSSVSAQRQKAKPQPPRVFTFDATASEIAVTLTQTGMLSRRGPRRLPHRLGDVEPHGTPAYHPDDRPPARPAASRPGP